MNSAVPVSDLLRKAKAVATKLKQNDLVSWLESEMSGYALGGTIPEYRRLAARAQFLNPVRGWCPIVGGEHTVAYGGSVGEINGLLEGDGDELVSPAPVEYVRHISQELGMQVDARRVISKAAMGTILDMLRNTVLDWALKLEQAGIHGEGLSFSQNESTKAQSVVFNIGSIGNATGLGSFGNNATITANVSGNVQIMAEKVRELVERAEKAVPKSGLSVVQKKAAGKQLGELKEEASGSSPARVN